MSSQKQRLIALAKAKRALRLKIEREKQSQPEGGLLEFVRYFWHVLEPVDPFIEGWALECLCAHLEAITRKEIIEIGGEERQFNRFLANVPPGFMKSLLVNVFWPAWEWGPMGLPHLRYVAFSYSPELTERDNAKFRNLICSRAYREMWGHVFSVVGDGKIRITNDKTGFKFASSFGGVATGERGHRVLLDDPHKLKGTHETDDARQNITNWVIEGMQNRLNDLNRDAIVVIMQRVHEADTSGVIQKKLGADYCQLIIPMAYEHNRHFSHYLGWNGGQDPRSEDGELAWPERYDARVLSSYKANQYLWSGQYQQNPTPRGGGLFKDDWWQMYNAPRGSSYDFVPVYTLASLDTAFKQKEENDYSALTIWHVYNDPRTGQRRIMLADAWQKRLPLHGTRVDREDGEKEQSYYRRAMPKWGLTEWVAYSCGRARATNLIVEDTARGTDVNNELRRLFSDRSWGVELVPARGDKWSRASSTVDLFTDDMIYAPGEWQGDNWIWRDFAALMIDESCKFPRGQHDDLIDSMVQALRFLRDRGYAIRREEKLAHDMRMAAYKPPSIPLYDV